MKILSENPKIEIWNDDCLEVLKTMSDKSVDLVLTDPPYGRNKADWDKEDMGFLVKVFNLLYQKMKENSWLIFDYDRTRILKLPLFTNDFVFVDVIGVNYSNTMGNCFCGFSPLELKFIFKKGKPKVIKRYKNLITTIRSQNSFDNLRAQHPTSKSIEPYSKIIEMFSKPNDTILDPFMGSGTTGVACANLNRNFIGIEISEKYCQISEERIMRVLNQRKLF